MEFKKERNFIVAYENGTALAKWNILTGEFIGKSGKVVTSCPRAFVYNNLPRYTSTQNENSLLGSAIREYRQAYSYEDEYNETRANRLEQLLSVGLFPSSKWDLDSETRLTKEIIQFFKENTHGIYNENNAQDFLKNKKYNSFLEGHPQWYKNTFLQCISDFPENYVKTFLNRAEHENLPSFWNYDDDEIYCIKIKITEILEGYYKKCMEMYGEVKVGPNILSNYAQINALYKQYMEAHYDETLTKNNNKPFLYFQYGEYEARPLLTREAFHAEGEAQHNCVERLYMPQVSEGQTYVVTVRRVDAPEKSLITCEVSKSGRIVQYYGFANSRVTNMDALAFKCAYEEHLRINIEK